MIENITIERMLEASNCFGFTFLKNLYQTSITFLNREEFNLDIKKYI